MKNIFKYILLFYQRYISIFFGRGCCRYYPTCSEYALWQLDNNSLLKALFFSSLRILKCNQLFKGGIEYPLVKREFSSSLVDIKRAKNFRDIHIKYWYVPKNKNIFYVIKEFKG